MTTIDFYTHAADRLDVAVRVVAKAYAAHGSARVLTPDRATTDALDRLLWIQSALSFLPHCRMDSAIATETPILIDEALDHNGPAAVLVNLRDQPAPFFSRFERLAEIVGTGDDELAAARERFRFYRERGYEMRSHNLSGALTMPTARELLEQAEALMRRDRMAALAADDDFPLLTDAVPDVAADEAAAAPASPIVVDVAMPAPVVPGDAPTLTDVVPLADVAPSEPAVARLVAEHIDVTQDQQGEPSIWVVPSNGAATITETGPDSLSPLNVDTREGPGGGAKDGDALWRDDAPEILESVSADTEVSGDASLADRGEDIVAPVENFPLDATLDATRWNLMAEDIRMQVLQRIDIFTDTGLRDQLNTRLQPIVDRASADLVAAINQHVGQILREYVAEAIEREIEKWRQEPR